jgi:hypothetical protein
MAGFEDPGWEVYAKIPGEGVDVRFICPAKLLELMVGFQPFLELYPPSGQSRA